jgi:hypothetical protein
MDQKMLNTKRRMNNDQGNELKMLSVNEREFDRN